MKTTLATLAAALAVLACAGLSPAQTAPKLGEGRGQITLTWDEFVKITGYDPAQKGAQTLTIPFADVEKLLGVKVEQVGKTATVDLPWRDFMALVEWSVKRKAPEEEAPPPTDYIVTSSRYTGQLSEEAAKFTLDAKVDVLRKTGWKRIPILPNTVALTASKLPEKVFLHSSGNRYELLTQESGTIPVQLEFSAAVIKSAGVNQVSFPRVAPGSSVVDLTMEAENVDVKVAAAQSTVKTTVQGKPHVVAAVPNGVPLTVSWERALPKPPPVPPKLYAETRTLVAVGEGMLLCREMVNVNVLHTPIRELKLQVPEGVSVLTVAGQSIQDWRVDKAGELSVTFRGEVIGSFSLHLTYESPCGESAEVPVLRGLGVERETGFIAVTALTNVEISAGAVTGATGIDARRLPPDIVAMTNQPILLAFRYVGKTFTIPLTIKKHAEVSVLLTIADTALFTGMQLDDGRRITRVVYSVRNNRNQFLRMKMPAGAEIWSVAVGGRPVSPAKDAAGNVLIPLIRSSRGARELASFPVEMVYVQTPAKPAPSKGTLRVELPPLGVPTMHLMFNYYLPVEGKYTVGLFGASGFSGPLRVVKKFTALAAGPGAEAIRRDAAKQVTQMQQAVQSRVEAEARAAGTTPIRVRLPIDGKLFKLEKILVLPQEKVWFEVRYKGWKPAK